MGLRKRQMLFVPEVNPTSFVFFFEKGDSGLSWSIRDYSEKGAPKQYGRSNFPWTADQVREKAKYSFDAPAVDTNENDYWHERTCEYNKTYLPGTAETAPKSGVNGAERRETIGAKEKIKQFLGQSPDVFTQAELALRASSYKRKIDGTGVSPATITRICKGQTVGRLNREAVAWAMNPVIPCTANDLLAPSETDAETP